MYTDGTAKNPPSLLSHRIFPNHDFVVFYVASSVYSAAASHHIPAYYYFTRAPYYMLHTFALVLVVVVCDCYGNGTDLTNKCWQKPYSHTHTPENYEVL